MKNLKVSHKIATIATFFIVVFLFVANFSYLKAASILDPGFSVYISGGNIPVSNEEIIYLHFPTPDPSASISVENLKLFFTINGFPHTSIDLPNTNQGYAQYTWNTNNGDFPNNSYEIIAKATIDGIEKHSAAITATVENQDPLMIEITQPLANEELSGVTLFKTISNRENAIVNFDIYDSSSVLIKDNLAAQVHDSYLNKYYYEFDTSALEAGTYKLVAKIEEPGGVSQSETFFIIKPVLPEPSISIIKPNEGIILTSPNFLAKAETNITATNVDFFLECPGTSIYNPVNAVLDNLYWFYNFNLDFEGEATCNITASGEFETTTQAVEDFISFSLNIPISNSDPLDLSDAVDDETTEEEVVEEVVEEEIVEEVVEEEATEEENQPEQNIEGIVSFDTAPSQIEADETFYISTNIQADEKIKLFLQDPNGAEKEVYVFTYALNQYLFKFQAANYAEGDYTLRAEAEFVEELKKATHVFSYTLPIKEETTENISEESNDTKEEATATETEEETIPEQEEATIEAPTEETDEQINTEGEENNIEETQTEENIIEAEDLSKNLEEETDKEIIEKTAIAETEEETIRINQNCLLLNITNESDCRIFLSLPQICKDNEINEHLECQRLLDGLLEDSSEISESKTNSVNSCQEHNILDENSCNDFLVQTETPSRCLRNGIRDQLECDQFLLAESQKDICREVNIDPNTSECLAYTKNKFIAQANCQDASCSNTIANTIGEIAYTQNTFKAITEIKEENKTTSVEDLKINLGNKEDIVPLLNNEQKISMIRAKQEIEFVEEKIVQTSPVILILDSDNDGLSDEMEILLRSNIYKKDTDGDSYSDFEEYKNGYNLLGPGKAKEHKKIPVLEAIVNQEEIEHPKTNGESSLDLIIEGHKEESEKDDTIISFYGQAEPNTVYSLFIYSDLPILTTVETDEYGNWQYNFKESIIDGKHEVYLALNDNTGKIVKKSSIYEIFVKEAKAVSPEDFVATALLETEDKTESMISIYLGLAALLSLAGIFMFVGYLKYFRPQID